MYPHVYKVKYLNSRYKNKKNSQALEVNERENCTREPSKCVRAPKPFVYKQNENYCVYITC